MRSILCYATLKEIYALFQCHNHFFQTFYIWNTLYWNVCITKAKNIFLDILSMRIYHLVLVYVCHFHHLHPVIFLSNHGLSRYSCLHLGSLHPRILKLHFWQIKQTYQHASSESRMSSLANVIEITHNKSKLELPKTVNNILTF